MNILPKKSWHVRTKKNIARVRKDEAKAAEEEKETQRRIALAAQEARTALLRERAGRRLEETGAGGRDHAEEIGGDEGGGDEGIPVRKEDDLRFGIALGSLKDVVQPDGHVNFFQDVEAGKKGGGGTNEEHEEEKKREQEEYEKKIGYLVYLGQDSLERSKDKPWWSKRVTGGGGAQSREGIEREVEKQRELDRAAGMVGGLEEKMGMAGKKKKGGDEGEEEQVTVEEVKMTKFKSYLDPMKDIRKYLSMPGMQGGKMGGTSKRKLEEASSPPRKRRRGEGEEEDDGRKKKKKKSKKKHKHHKHSSERRRRRRKGDSSSEGEGTEGEEEEEKRRKLKKLREERLEREREERRRAQKVLAKLRGEEEPVEVDRGRGKGGGDHDPKNESPSKTMASVKQKYNSQFNPHLARQNYD